MTPRPMIQSTAQRLRGFATNITDVGWLCIGLAGLGAGVYCVTYWAEFLAIGAVMTVLILAAVLLCLGNIRFTAAITVATPRLTVGESTDIAIEVTNNRPAPTAAARASLTLGSQSQSLHVPALAPHSTRRLVLPFHAAHRGTVAIGPLQIHRTDPFGLFRREHLTAQPTIVSVHPKTIPLSTGTIGTVRDLDGEASARIVDDDLFFYGLRTYEPGDDLRHIHWISSAKTGHLMVRQFQATTVTSTHLGLVTSPADFRTPEEFELAVSTFASLGVGFLSAHRCLNFSYGSHAAHATTPQDFLDVCSSIQPEATVSVSGVLTRAKTATQYFFVFGPHRSLADIQHTMGALPHQSSAVVITVDPLATTAVARHNTLLHARLHNLADLPVMCRGLA